jgi:selenocysteine lyase/cysteine desulfurase
VTATLTASACLDGAVGSNESARSSSEELNGARAAVARLLDVNEKNVAFMETTSSAWAMSLASLAHPSRRISFVTVRNEWGPNILTARSMNSRGLLEMSVQDSGPYGRFDTLALAATARDADVVAVPMIPVSSGLINPITDLRNELGSSTLLFVDAAQAVGQIPVFPRELGADVLVFPGRKWLRGPKGIAVLYLSDRALERMERPFFIDQGSGYWGEENSFTSHSDASRFERFDYYPGLRLGLKAAVEEATEIGMARIAGTIAHLSEGLQEAFLRYRLPYLFESSQSGTSGLWTFTCPEVSTRADIECLRQRGLAVAGIGQNYARLALADRKTEIILRLSLHYLNTGEEIDMAAQLLAEFIEAGRK